MAQGLFVLSNECMWHWYIHFDLLCLEAKRQAIIPSFVLLHYNTMPGNAAIWQWSILSFDFCCIFCPACWFTVLVRSTERSHIQVAAQHSSKSSSEATMDSRFELGWPIWSINPGYSPAKKECIWCSSFVAFTGDMIRDKLPDLYDHSCMRSWWNENTIF